MEFKGIQKQVDDWVSQYEEGYWPLPKMTGQLLEEIGEFVEEVLRKSVIPISGNIELLTAFSMAIEAGIMARKALDKSGRKKKKKTNEESSPSEEALDIQFTLACIFNLLLVELDREFKERMEKKQYGRDDKRFKKKGETKK